MSMQKVQDTQIRVHRGIYGRAIMHQNDDDGERKENDVREQG